MKANGLPTYEMTGASSFTSMERVAVLTPAVLLAVTEYWVAGATCTGVPVIAQELAATLSPAGSGGAIWQPVIVPPLFVAESGEIGWVTR